MSNSTLSTLNKYLLTTHGEPPPPPEPVLTIYTNYTFGYMDTNLLNLIRNASGYDCVQTYNLTNGSQSWMNGEYESFTSSNVNYNGFNGFYFSTMFQDGDGTLDFWGNNVNTSTQNYFWNGVNKGKYTVATPYNSSGTYVGGGTGSHFFTTVHNGGSVNGEFFQLKFPYGVKPKSLGFKKRSNRGFEIQYVTILGSDNGTTWTKIQDLNYSMSFSDNGLKSLNITTSNTYNYIRMVFTKNKTSGTLIHMREMRFIFDAHVYV